LYERVNKQNNHKQQSTKHAHKPKDRLRRTSLKSEGLTQVLRKGK